MLTFTKYNIFKYNRSCIFTAVKDRNSWKLVSSLDPKEIVPLNESWFSNSRIFNAINDNRLEVAMSLLDDKDFSLSFSVNFSIDKSKLNAVSVSEKELFVLKENEKLIESSKMQIIKQGSDNLNGILDAYVVAARCTDKTTARFFAKVYFMRTDRINLCTFVYDLDESLLDDDINLCFEIDAENYIANLLINGKQKKTFQIPLTSSAGLQLNVPFKDKHEYNHFTVGNDSSAFNMNGVTVFRKPLNVMTLKNVITAFE